MVAVVRAGQAVVVGEVVRVWLTGCALSLTRAGCAAFFARNADACVQVIPFVTDLASIFAGTLQTSVLARVAGHSGVV